MPSFSSETLEEWRAERVKDITVEDGLTEWQQKTMREVLEEDLREEKSRLENAQRQIEESKTNIRRLLRRSDLLKSKYGI